MNPYQPTSDLGHKFRDTVRHNPSWLGVVVSRAYWLLSGFDFLLLPIAIVGVILRVEEGIRLGTLGITMTLELACVPICLAVAGCCAASASMSWKSGRTLSAMTHSLIASTTTAFPWVLAYASNAI